MLVDQGYEVIGMFMKNWHDETVTISNECPWMEDSTDAMLVADDDVGRRGWCCRRGLRTTVAVQLRTAARPA